ncbi:hypothetical protein MtrunA17_Chr7g0252591 [Medicago truncatula]|uniref:Transmembrane protein, putative n=1 Tax=Medicago truncatula TaxID=3880 RepID=Q2HRU9_MEDTR|nr:hypothetical protein MtrDRAFT_AC157890g23v2 [Medicago truncatula]AES80762.1 transmembrane protein, putative [Medicago truncatula]RHN47402.1 hypothetical protein MtrunA17_Chr7g0252591 [Medicago truncatula]
MFPTIRPSQVRSSSLAGVLPLPRFLLNRLIWFDLLISVVTSFVQISLCVRSGRISSEKRSTSRCSPAVVVSESEGGEEEGGFYVVMVFYGVF